jgi:CDP-paratose 2-epimerase
MQKILRKSGAKSKNLLVTGGAGFIGINTARHFLKKGWRVTIFDNFSRKGTDINVENLKHEHKTGWRVVRGDVVKNADLLEKEVAKADAVIHLAAQVAVTTSIASPADDLSINIIGTFNVLEAVRQSKHKPALLYSSTNKVYGALPHYEVEDRKNRYSFKNKQIQKYGISERELLDFHSPYGCSKGAADQYVIDYGRIYDLDTVVFRQSCIYGENQFGVEDQGWVAWFTIAAMHEKPIILYGTGKQVRDVLYVGDLVALYEKAITNMKKVKGRAYNVGGGPENTLSLLEFLPLLERELNIPIEYSFSSVRAGDQPIFVADTRLITDRLGWSPATNFLEGFTRMRAWMEKHKESLLPF